ncbi:MAG: hypothetical protein IKB96_03390, partial [Prevotella sp.]|nr:hypothetical protein [Prevotella sp.]
HWRFFDKLGGISIDDYNKAIRRAASNCHVNLADLAKRIRLYETLDGTHPTALGHQMIAEEWIACLSKLL